MNNGFAVVRLSVVMVTAILAACVPGGQAQQGGGGSAPTKRALLIGIDRYRSPTISTLRGAVNDVERMKAVLIGKFDFSEQNIRTLTNEQATHEAIVRAIQGHLIAQAQSGDIVVIQFSGHGSQMPDNTGDETDRLDETLVSHDSRTANVFDISDDEINGLLGQLAQKTDNVTLIFDSCHSGTGTRAAGLARWVPPDTRVPPPPPSHARSAEATSTAGLREQGANFVLLAAARSDQLAFEYSSEGSDYGAFSYFLAAALEQGGAGMTYRDIMDRVRDQVSARYGRQDPQIEGTGEHTFVFSDSTSIADPYFLAAPLAGGKATVRGGAVHGVTKGSVFEVYTPATRRFAPPAAPTATVEITHVGVLTSEASVRQGGRVDSNARAVERQHAYGDQKLRIHYRGIASSPTLRAVKATLDTLNHIQEQREPVRYDLLLREDRGHIVFEAPDTLELSARVPIAQPSAVDTIVGRVQHWVRWYNLLAIRNATSTLSLGVTLAGGREYFDGDRLEITVTNRSGKDVFVSILDLSSDGSVAQAFPHPNEGGAELLPAGRSRAIPLEVFVPEDRTSVKDILKVFAATTVIDLRPLTQPPIVAREAVGTRGGGSPLEQLLGQAAVGATRGAQSPVPLGSWVVEEQSFIIKRRP